MVSKPFPLYVLQINCCTANSRSLSAVHCSVQQQKEQGTTAQYLTDQASSDSLSVPKQPLATEEKSSAADTRVCMWRYKEMKHYWQKGRWGQPVLGNSTSKYLNHSCQPSGGFQSLTQSWCLPFPLLKSIGCSPPFLQNKWQPPSSVSTPLPILVIFSLSSFMVSAENCSFLTKNYHFNITK